VQSTLRRFAIALLCSIACLVTALTIAAHADCSPAQLNACAATLAKCRAANGGDAAPCSKPMGNCIVACGKIPPNCQWLQDQRRFVCQ
jgi:hypothetical protein